ncbi:MAG: lectin [Gammaproteobacteria bacterium]|nr:lectin [Gammaproteobacteria bacterium]
MLVWALPGVAQDQQPMTFFVASDGPGNGGNLGGLTGADALCQRLAASADRGDATWHAYLSQAPTDGLPRVDARDRIGSGPWHNAKGDLIAANVADLHEDRNNIRKYTALNEHGEEVEGRGDQPNRHDILTGSDSMGRLFDPDPAVSTCNNWTSSSDEHTTRVGHHDRLGGANASWNSVHNSRGCSQEALISSGGDGLLYCFAGD